MRATAQAYGKTVDNVLRLEVLTCDGERFWAGPTSDDEYEAIVAEGGRRAEIYRQLRELAEAIADRIRERYPRIPRRVSGYNLLTVAGGIDKRRTIPLFAPQTLQAWMGERDPGAAGHARQAGRGEVVLWPDTFTNHLTPGIGKAAVEAWRRPAGGSSCRSSRCAAA